MPYETPESPMPHLDQTQILSTLSALLLHNDRLQALGLLDIDGLDVAVQLLLGALLVVSSSGDAYADSVWNALNTLLPHLLVQLGVQADVSGTLKTVRVSNFDPTRWRPTIFFEPVRR